MKILTWNSQGCKPGGYLDRIQKEKPDIMVLQECGNLPKELGYPIREYGELTRIGPINDYYFWYYNWDRQGGDGNPRCSMAMAYPEDGMPFLAHSVVNDKRPIMMKSIGSMLVANIHAPAGTRDLGYIIEAVDLVKRNKGSREFIIVGDFNQDPSKIQQIFKDYQVIRTHTATHVGGSEYDYALSNTRYANYCNAQIYTTHGSDHITVIINIP